MDVRRRAQMGGIKNTSSGGDIEIDTTTIYYTSSDGNIVTPFNQDAFGANIVSNTYDAANECWVIKFDGEVTTIGYQAFYKCSSLTGITIPDSVTEIGSDAFYECSSLTSVVIPDSVTKIDGAAFYYCSSLTSVIIPDSVTTIVDYTFASCISLTSVTIGDGVTTIGDYVFSWCSSLTSVYCKAITPPVLGGGSVFDSNSSGRTIYVPTEAITVYKSKRHWIEYADAIVGYNFEDDGEVDIDTTYAIYYTSSDGNIVTPYSTAVFGANIVSNNYINGQGIISFDGPVTSIGNKAFYSCSSLTSVTIGNSVTMIGEYAFADCSSLTSVTIPDSVTTIGHSAFSSCESLREFNGKYASEDGRCLIVNGILNSFAPAGLTEYTITSVTMIGYGAFYNCSSLTSVTISDSVTSIGKYAFDCCSSLTSVYCKAKTPPAGGSYMFNSNASSRKIYVPMASVAAYKSASYWSDYVSYIVGYIF